MADSSREQINDLLIRWGRGEQRALDILVPLVYRDLRRIASYLLRNQRSGNTLQPTVLVNEVYLKLSGQQKARWQNRTHFFAVAARAMRQILIDYARSHLRDKRGKGIRPIPLDEILAFVPERSADLLALDEALERLNAIDSRKVQVVEMRIFGGLNNQEMADVLQVSANTVMRDWNMAKAWLRREMESGTIK